MLQHYPDPGGDSHFTDSCRWWQALTAPELRIVICHDEVEVFLFQRPWQQRGRVTLLSHQHYPLAGNARDMLPVEEMWRLLRDICTPYAGRYLHVVVILSNQYTRWLVLPWQSEIRSPTEKQAYYSHGLQQAFGAEMHDWKIESQASAYGQHILLNAVPPGLTEKLQVLFAEYGLTPGVVASAWVFAVNQAMQLIREQKAPLDGWIISRESNNLTIGCLVKGEWQQIRQMPVDSDWQTTLHQFLLRAQVIHPEFVSLPVYLPQAKLSGVSSQSLSPFIVKDVQPSRLASEAFHLQFRQRLA